MTEGLYIYQGFKMIGSLLIIGLVTSYYMSSVFGSLVDIPDASNTTAYKATANETIGQGLGFSCPTHAMIVNCCLLTLGVRSCESKYTTCAFNLPADSAQTCQHSRMCESELRRKFNQFFGCALRRSWNILFHGVNEHLVNEIEEVMNDLGTKTSSIRAQLPINVTEILDKVKRWDRLTIFEETSSFLLIMSTEAYTELMSSLQFQETMTTWSRLRRSPVLVLVCGRSTCPWESFSPNLNPVTFLPKSIVIGIQYKRPSYCNQKVYCPRSDCDVRVHTVADNGVTIPWSCTSDDMVNKVSVGIRNLLAGRHLIASTNEWPPFVIKRQAEGGGMMYEGFCIDIWRMLSDRLNFTYEFVEPSDGEWGKLVNDTWTGLVGQLQKREVDVAVAPLSAQPARAPVMDVSQSYLQLEGKLLVARSTDTQFHSLLYVFTAPVLVLLAVVPLLVAMLLVVLEKLMGRYNNNSWTKTTGVTKLSNAILLVYGAVVCQASPFRPQSVSGRTVVAFWWLFGIVFVNTFSAYMIASLAAPSTRHDVSSLKELVNSPNYKWGMLGSTIFPFILKNSKNPVFQKLWQGISKLSEEDESILSDDFEVHLQRMRTEKYAYIGPVPALNFYNASHCEFRSGRDSFFTARYVFGLPKNSPYTEVISRELLDFEELGFMLAIKRRWFHIQSKCDHQVHHKQTVVGLIHVQAAFFALAVGIAAAGFVLIWEKILRLCHEIIVENKT